MRKIRLWKLCMVGVDWTIRKMRDMTVSNISFGSGWMFTYKDRVQLRRATASDYVYITCSAMIFR